MRRFACGWHQVVRYHSDYWADGMRGRNDLVANSMGIWMIQTDANKGQFFFRKIKRFEEKISLYKDVVCIDDRIKRAEEMSHQWPCLDSGKAQGFIL